MIDAENSRRNVLRVQETAGLGREIAGACVTECPISYETMEVRRAHTTRDAVQLRLVPRDGKRDGRVLQRAEIVSVRCVLPEIVGVDQQILPDRLLQAYVVLIAPAWRNWRCFIDPQHSRGYAVAQTRGAR